MTNFIDLNILNFFISISNKGFHILDSIMIFFTVLGDDGYIFIATSIILLIFKKTRSLGILLAISLLLTLAVSSITKHEVHRLRPYEVFTNIKLLIDKGFDISKSNNHDLLSLAVTKKDLNMITFLLDNGVLLSESEAFSVCCESGNSEIMEFFLNMGINPNEVLNNGRLPLELAIKHNNIEVIKTLI